MTQVRSSSSAPRTRAPARSQGLLFRTAILVVLTLMTAAACKRQDVDEDPAARLRKLAVPPKELPPSCQLTWSSVPYAMSSKMDPKLLAMMAQFWFGPEDAPKPDQLRSGLSNVYSPRESPRDGPLVVMMFDFKSEQDAAGREKQLERRYASSPIHIHRRGALLLAMSFTPPVEEKCALDAWNATIARIDQPE